MKVARWLEYFFAMKYVEIEKKEITAQIVNNILNSKYFFVNIEKEITWLCITSRSIPTQKIRSFIRGEDVNICWFFEFGDQVVPNIICIFTYWKSCYIFFFIKFYKKGRLINQLINLVSDFVSPTYFVHLIRFI